MTFAAIAGWALAALFFALWLDAARRWDRADNEATYAAWKERMRIRIAAKDVEGERE